MGLLDSIEISSLITETKENIKRIYLQDKLPWIIGYSGGKDSTCTTQIIVDTLIELKKKKIPLEKEVYIISSDTMVETPMIVKTIENTIERIGTLAREYRLPIHASIVRPLASRSFWTNLIGKGYPSPNQNFRWCTDRLKIEPANIFTQSLIEQYGEVVMILGVREKESNSRDRVLESHTIEGKDFMRHTTQANSYVFAPIRRFSKDDVWNYLLSYPSPWGADNHALFKLYQDSLTGEDCPMMMTEEDKKRTTCGNSRFGCWVCTVVTEDKSLTGFIKSGVKWLLPLLEYRNWLVSIRDDDTRRMKRRINGTLYFSKIYKGEEGEIVIHAKGARQKNVIRRCGEDWLDSQGQKWQVFLFGQDKEGRDSEQAAREYISQNNIDVTIGKNPRIIIQKIDGEFYQLGLGPFTLDTRKEILEKLLITQRNLEEPHELIKKEELKEIQKLWYESGDLQNSVAAVYYKVFGRELELETDDVKLFEEEDHLYLKELCFQNGLKYELFRDLLNIEKRCSGISNRVEATKSIKDKLSQEFLVLREEVDIDES